MKLLCETRVYNRRSSGEKRSCFLKSTLLLRQDPPNKKNAELFLIRSTRKQNNTGTRYKLNRNVQRIHTNFVHEVKATISLLQPEHDLMIRSDDVQLNGFVHAMRLGLSGNTLPIDEMLATTPFLKSKPPITRMKIFQLSKYPLRGFPSTLQTLAVGK